MGFRVLIKRRFFVVYFQFVWSDSSGHKIREARFSKKNHEAVTVHAFCWKFSLKDRLCYFFR